jgi:hypothetical protein
MIYPLINYNVIQQIIKYMNYINDLVKNTI